MGSEYHRDIQTPYLVAFWKNYRSCGPGRLVDEYQLGVYYHKSR